MNKILRKGRNNPFNRKKRTWKYLIDNNNLILFQYIKRYFRGLLPPLRDKLFFLILFLCYFVEMHYLCALKMTITLFLTKIVTEYIIFKSRY
ncbi:hypothetical protein IX320_000719 [Bacteroides pyogenes]|uniref:Uncharacterized protein n=2 Tax=Bacteroides pyogenes TaxID=310300 RepID=W4PGT4_9BACE|nr:hypothetical protein [Bacteroides pyogenes]MBR8746309.1 hypothetical protein [Bacteroides pyogenes]MBR8779807.1 hypothetical protein [Bacteroides pyogenes]GAE14690.1 hypothetical protein JCM6292_859 [Bacteroides pyogenes JCM 6292]GAE18369.1 hypothetical protein JCM6294_1254 [Bacteroides pyogenes DSM 20611 = JCM 6294]